MLTAEANPVNSTTARAGAGTLPTYTYELVGGQNLKDHPREQVTIKGRLDEDKDRVEVEKKERSEQATDQKGSTPIVDLKQEVDLRVRRLFVESVTPTGQPCDSAAK